MPEPDNQIQLGDHLLDEWAATRGPLFEDPRAAVCRIFAVMLAGSACRSTEPRDLRLRAARLLEQALAPVRPSNRPATNEQRARANMALVDIRRTCRAAKYWEDITDELEGILSRAAPGRGLTEQIRTRAWAEHLAAIVQGENSAIRLRAARTVLARTADAYRRVGPPARPESAKKRRSRTDAPAADTSGDCVPPQSRGALGVQQSYACSADPTGRSPP